jgi:hypothetical protein
MAVGTTLKDQVRSAALRGGAVPAFHAVVIADLLSAVNEFALAPDELVDIGRLPVGVVSLKTLVDYLKTIQTEMGKRDPKVKTEDWSMAKSGQLRLYKLFVCAIHALSGYIDDTPDWTKSLAVFADGIVLWAPNHPPAGMSEKGTKMWSNTFSPTSPRTKMVLVTLIMFCIRDSRNADGGPVPPPPGEHPKSSDGKLIANAWPAANSVNNQNLPDAQADVDCMHPPLVGYHLSGTDGTNIGTMDIDGKQIYPGDILGSMMDFYVDWLPNKDDPPRNCLDQTTIPESKDVIGPNMLPLEGYHVSKTDDSLIGDVDKYGRRIYTKTQWRSMYEPYRRNYWQSDTKNELNNSIFPVIKADIGEKCLPVLGSWKSKKDGSELGTTDAAGNYLYTKEEYYKMVSDHRDWCKDNGEEYGDSDEY